MQASPRTRPGEKQQQTSDLHGWILEWEKLISIETMENTWTQSRDRVQTGRRIVQMKELLAGLLANTARVRRRGEGGFWLDLLTRHVENDGMCLAHVLALSEGMTEAKNSAAHWNDN